MNNRRVVTLEGLLRKVGAIWEMGYHRMLLATNNINAPCHIILESTHIIRNAENRYHRKIRNIKNRDSERFHRRVAL